MNIIYSIEKTKQEAVYSDRIENIQLALPEGDVAGLVAPPSFHAPAPDCIERAFADPVGSPMLREMAKGKRTVSIIVSDSTRNVPTARILPHIMRELTAGGIAAENVVVVVAIGVHRSATEEEMREIVGEELWSKIPVKNHDPYDAEKLVSLGTTPAGTPVSVNKTVYEADLRISIGKVEPHEFAGFSGGRKSVLPGVSSEQSIKTNHRPEMILHPGAAIGSMEENPVSRDMLDAAKMMEIHFCVNVLVDSNDDLIHVVCGEMEKSHLAAVEKLRESIGTPLKTRPSILVTTPGSPLNINLYQSIKPIIAAAPVMAENGIIILYSRCTEGVGSTDMLVPFRKGKSIDDIVNFLKDNYEIQMDHALLLCKILQTGIRIIVVSPNIDAETVRLMHLLPAPSLEEAVAMAHELSGKEKQILFFPCPQRVLPYIS